MSLKSITSRASQRGFTIVELLIVIVIIGILAAIVIVAYNGLTNRAKAAGYQSDANSIVKVAEAINAELGGYPTTNAGFAPSNFDTAKLPGNVKVALTTGTVTNSESSGTSAPSTSNHTWAVYTNTTTGDKYYSFKACGASTGVTVYYWSNSGTLGKASAGTGC